MAEFILTTKEELRALVHDIINERPIVQSPTVDELLTRQEAAALLKVSLVTLDTWVRQGKVPAMRIGRKVRFQKSAVEKSLKKIQL